MLCSWGAWGNPWNPALAGNGPPGRFSGDTFHRHWIPEDVTPRGGGRHPGWRLGFRPSGRLSPAGAMSAPGASVSPTQWSRRQVCLQVNLAEPLPTQSRGGTGWRWGLARRCWRPPASPSFLGSQRSSSPASALAPFSLWVCVSVQSLTSEDTRRLRSGLPPLRHDPALTSYIGHDPISSSSGRAAV